MNKSYLKGLAELFYRAKGEELYKYRFFFQNKRAGTFFSHYLLQEGMENGNKPLLLPETTTLYNYLRRCSNLPEEDINNNLLVIFHLYLVYKENYPLTSDKKDYGFEHFYDLGKQLLSDFNDIDLHLAPTARIFQNMDELGKLTVNPNEYLNEEQQEALSRFVHIMKKGEKPFDKEYSGFWSKIGKVYTELKDRLKQEQLTYTGMLMREIVERNEQLGADKINVFIGLNGLSMSEQKILKLFPNDTLYYWDYDSDLLKKSFTEKSSEVTTIFPEPSGELKYERQAPIGPQEIKYISVPSRVAQSIYIDQQVLGKIDWSRDENISKLNNPQIAIVLPDEGQLIPLLSNLSLKPNQLNITMGFPIKELPIANKILQLLSLQKRVYNRNNRWRRDELKVVISLGLTEEKIDEKQLFEKFKDYRLYFNASEILEQLEGTHKECAALLLAQSGTTLIDNTLQLFKQLPTEGDTEKDVLKLLEEKLQLQLRSLERFVEGNAARSEINKFETHYDLIITTIKQARIPFEGEPLRGVQIMGMLEARSIDFDTVIIMDAGEGMLPANSKKIGLLPQSLRAGFGLPTYQWQDHIRAYNFFRLICRAREVHAIYDSRKSDRSSGEPSRYLTLLTHIYGKEAEHIEASIPVRPIDNNSTNLKLDRSKINTHQHQLCTGERSLSPSSLIKFICCPRQYYYENILGLKQEEEITEILQKKEFGTFIHDSIQQLYEGFKGQIVDNEMLKGITEAKIEEVVKQNFCSTLGLDPDNIEGYINAYISTAIKIVENQIKMDLAENIPFKYIGGEVPVRSKFEYKPGELISLYGKLDRIDIKEGRVRIIDYKTGSDQFEGDIEKSFEANNKHTFKVLLQLLTYSYMMLHPTQGEEIIDNLNASSIVPLMMKPTEKLQRLFQNAKQEVNSYQDLQTDFEELLKETIARLMDKDYSFETNNKKANCDYCGGASICRDFKSNNY